MTRPQKVTISDLCTIRMVQRDQPVVVIDRGTVKRWVGFGWIAIAPATEEDYAAIPEVDYEERRPNEPITNAASPTHST